MLTPRWSPMRFHVEQQRLWTSPARFKLVVAGRSSGKTELRGFGLPRSAFSLQHSAFRLRF